MKNVSLHEVVSVASLLYHEGVEKKVNRSDILARIEIAEKRHSNLWKYQ